MSIWEGSKKFAFTVQLGAIDVDTCRKLKEFFGVGHVWRYSRRKAHYDDEVHFTVSKAQDLVDVILPFMDEHLPPSYKRQQYEAWKIQLLEYWEFGIKRLRVCVEPNCDALQRAKGLCRHHYYEAYVGRLDRVVT
jgi:hypothetical protein